MRRILSAMVILVVAGCASTIDRPTNWVTRSGYSLADAGDYDDCLRKARDTTLRSSDGGGPVYSVSETDHTLLAVCMEAHGYRLRGRFEME
jgi:hypothetical protein